MPVDGSERFLRALAGARLSVPVAGLTFVDPALMSDEPEAGSRAPARALARACEAMGLDFAFVPSWEPWAADATAQLRERGVATLWAVPGVLTPALDALGYGVGLRAIVTDSDRIAREMDEAEARAHAALEAGLAEGVTAIVVADDLAGVSGPIVSPAFLGAEVFPRLARIAARTHETGLPAMLHCDGDVRAIVSGAARAGFAAVHGDAGGAAGIARTFDAARDAGLALLGGVPTGDLAPGTGTPLAFWRAHILAAVGGLLLCDDGGVTTREEFLELSGVLREARTAAQS